MALVLTPVDGSMILLGMMIRSFAVLLLVVWGCGGSSGPPASSRSATSAPVQQAGEGQREGLDERLFGYWQRYWAPGGKARSERFVFLPDGRWGWIAPEGVHGVVKRSGRWSVDERGVLQLVEERRTEATCASEACESPSVEAITTSLPRPEALPLGPCPRNEEAEQQDLGYRCLSFGGRAFWLYADHEQPSSHDFF